MDQASRQGMHWLEAAGPPGMRVIAIGDVHGRFDLLEAMHEAIARELASDPPDDWRMIHLGDYVDRGPQSREVISRLRMMVEDDPRVIALCGNHDTGMTAFLDQPAPATTFAAHGGRQTALSYGVESDLATDEACRSAAEAMRQAMAPEDLAFMRTLPRHAAFGNFFFCHAGIRPGIPLDRQDPHDLIWIRETFLRWPGLHEKVVVHGHTPHHVPEILPNRVNVDTEAWRSGVLSALVIDGERKRIVQVSDSAQRAAWTTP